MLAGVTDCRRSQKWGYRGRRALGFKPRHGSRIKRGPHNSEGEERGPCGFGGEERGSCSFGEVNREDHVVLGCSFLPRGLGSRRDFAGKKRGERLLLVGREKVPHGFGLLEIAAATQLMVPGA